jgi:hypothetical protein
MGRVNRTYKGRKYVTQYTGITKRTLYYKVKNKKNLEDYPIEINVSIKYRKNHPTIEVTKDRKVIWRCKDKPLIILDFETGDISSPESRKKKVECNNQACHTINASKKIGRMEARYGKRRNRRFP